MSLKVKRQQKKRIKTKLRMGDEVMVIAGKDKGRHGEIKQLLREQCRVVVDGINMIKKHLKPNPQKGLKGGIVEREASIAISNVAIFNATTNKADRIAYKILNDEKKVRVYRSTGEMID